MKILQIYPNILHSVNGIGTYCNALVSLFRNDKDIEMEALTECKVIETKLVNNAFGWSDLWRRVKASDADIIHVNGYTSFVSFQAFLIAALQRKKCVYTAHWHPFCMLSRPSFAQAFFNILLLPFIRHANKVITINNEDTAFFNKLSLPVEQIPHWSRFGDKKPSLTSKKKSNMILFVGRFNADNKGFDYLYSLPEGTYDIHCVGRGEVVPRADMTLHTDIPTEELQRLYSEAALVVIPSKYEAFSYVALEAFFYGTPVVMSDRVRIADYLSDSEGYSVFPYGDKQAFVNAVETTIGSAVDTEKILSIFSPQRIKERYRSLYSSVANN